MKVKTECSKIIKPFYEGNTPSTTNHTPLSIFDKITYDTHIAVIYAYRPPTPSNEAIELGLQKALSVYREFAGRFGKDENGDQVILLNDEGVRFVEASADWTLHEAMPLKPSPSILSLHPSLHGVEELVQVQLTRFKCGSLVIGFTAHHYVADGESTSSFLVAWGQATREVDISPIPSRETSIFAPRDPPTYDFEHNKLEYTSPFKEKCSITNNDVSDEIMVHKVHFTREFLNKLKAKTSSQDLWDKPYTTFECLVAHLWRVITKARGLGGHETTHARISINGRTRLSPKVPNYFGNLVLWAFPTTTVRDLLNQPVSYAAQLIHDEIAKVNNDYFKSFIDFANCKAKDDDLVTTADSRKQILSPNIDVDSWLRFPFYDLDFGTGCPFIFLPSYMPIEGLIFLLPSYVGDGSMEVFVAMFKDNLDVFKEFCYCID
ncbi:hypothetical protein Leryth_000710 [Lithospermum erythrorhizon]|nr:hypothetical protein Leryth_000710 [Lithospermum erythrorhizon]